MKLAAEHEYGVYAKTVKNNDAISEEDKKYILDQLKANFQGECSEVGMYLCMARIAHREGYPEIGLYWEKAAFEEAEHAAKFAELLGSELEPKMTAKTKDNLAWRVDKSAISFRDALNAEVRRRRLDWIEFVPCSKYEIRDRVAVDNYMMSNFRLRVDKQRCGELLDEMSNAVWDEKQVNKPKRKDKNDHSINAHEYGFEPEMYSGIIKEEDIPYHYHLFSKRGKTNIK